MIIWILSKVYTLFENGKNGKTYYLKELEEFDYVLKHFFAFSMWLFGFFVLMP